MSTAAATPKGAISIWLVALTVYVVAIFHRSSMAVAGLAASDRFDISAAQLSTFVMLQLAVYAGMQIPVGIMLDRYGPRRILTLGSIVLIIAQVIFAYTESYPVALFARTLVGLGDAMTFVCVLRLVSSWFPARRIPLVTQLTGAIGQLGAIAAAVPMSISLHRLGWTPTYLGAAGVGIAVLALLLVVIHDVPGQWRCVGPALSLSLVRSSVVDSWKHPGTRLGFWTHFTTQFSANVLSLLWGYPFFVRGEGRSPAEAGLLLTVLVVAVIGAGPVLAAFITRHPWHRSDLVLCIVLVIAGTWAVVLSWPGPAPMWLLLSLVIVTGVGAPASLIGFDFGRSFNPSNRLGTANGIINQGGFIAALIAIVLVGLVLDWRTPGGGSNYSHNAFIWAMSTQFLLWGIGGFQILRLRRRTRETVLRDDPAARDNLGKSQ